MIFIEQCAQLLFGGADTCQVRDRFEAGFFFNALNDPLGPLLGGATGAVGDRDIGGIVERIKKETGLEPVAETVEVLIVEEILCDNRIGRNVT